jgi:hypothetical protein
MLKSSPRPADWEHMDKNSNLRFKLPFLAVAALVFVGVLVAGHGWGAFGLLLVALVLVVTVVREAAARRHTS